MTVVLQHAVIYNVINTHISPQQNIPFCMILHGGSSKTHSWRGREMSDHIYQGMERVKASKWKNWVLHLIVSRTASLVRTIPHSVSERSTWRSRLHALEKSLSVMRESNLKTQLAGTLASKLPISSSNYLRDPILYEGRQLAYYAQNNSFSLIANLSSQEDCQESGQ